VLKNFLLFVIHKLNEKKRKILNYLLTTNLLKFRFIITSIIVLDGKLKQHDLITYLISGISSNLVGA